MDAYADFTIDQYTTLQKAVLLLAHAIRLNSTAPLTNGDGPEWPTYSDDRMRLIHEALKGIDPIDPTVCAAMIFLDDAFEDLALVEHDQLVSRFESLCGRRLADLQARSAWRPVRGA